ncbi:hypothetical protein [Photobacterium aquimaris]|uniref:Uncharacterized protein n=1 Tax=Photobacterium aquimaris TaxID=512643 RepID=A0A1Y6KYF7_9GAMM|nr:hypothetical protein [Photobacterium aquimaris]SMY16185.1 hypothetical protein PAQU9191_01416 [Photobacterium aquimaris]
MAKVHISQLHHTFQRALTDMVAGEAIEARTFKKDRGIAVLKQDVDHFIYKQFGFDNKTLALDSVSLLKLLKKAIAKEFPRSNMAWIVHFEGVTSIETLTADHSSQPSLF